MSRLAKRLQDFDSSDIRGAFAAAKKIKNPIDLSIGFPGEDTPPHIKAAGIAAIKAGHTRYLATSGLPELRLALAAKLRRQNKIASKLSQVTITPGTTTAILLAYLAILDPGDEILVPEPYFPPYVDIAKMIGAKPKIIDTFPSFQLTAELIEPLITSRTKALLINSPNNPSGAIYPKAEIIKIAKLAKKHGLVVLSDEVYEYFAYDRPHFSVGSVYPDTLTLNSFSKSYSMTGWRVGYVNGPVDIIEAINDLQQYIVFSSSSMGQYAALEALQQPLKASASEYEAKRNAAKKILEKSFGEISGGQGAFYFFLKLPVGVDDLTFVGHLLRKGVIALPGRAFCRRSDYIRISFADGAQDLAEGLRQVCAAVEFFSAAKS